VTPRFNARVRELFQTVGLDPTALRRYPHEFSGGQAQRIRHRAFALAESVARRRRRAGLGLDVSVQARA